ncbi:MAG: DUF2304 domain-containing protein [Sulfuricella sp.]|nr:DUF2304 domain-containing protein [Sulfuricella sp.]
MISYHLTTAGFSIAIAVTILFLVRRDHLRIRYAYWWLLAALGVLFLGLFPGATDVVAPYLGIKYPPIIALICGMTVILIKMLLMDLEHTRQEREIRRLAQRLAMWEQQAGASPETNAALLDEQ